MGFYSQILMKDITCSVFYQKSSNSNPLLFISGCLLVNKQWATASALPKPVLKLVTQHPKGIIVKGDNITWKCLKGSEEANEFNLVHNKESGGNETYNSRGTQLLVTDIHAANNGDYFCKYCDKSACSEPSNSRNIYVRETFPRPEIFVIPRRAVQPGATITITCRTYYSDVEFSLQKNDEIVTHGHSGNSFSYVISNAQQNSAGYYSCMYQSKSKGIQSDKSNPMKISVIELPAPSITWEEDPSDSTILRINCTATDHTYNQFFFVLLDGSKVIEDDIPASSVNFSVAKPMYTMKRY
ncbi:osteoclast-associated immunoglobulin-like receptor [Hyla sarda]|uniref:osteoclast-associated immunoglobulin-like receptor n=1 Tax=Hyla sarda TaxID=327740 RepID=UPI0024C24BB9|nr:osteoclast-associated immunoglobulin-like receptor [Hyla sarda]